MYKIDLYPEFAAVKRAEHADQLRVVVSLCLVALPVLLLGTLLASFLHLGDERQRLRTSIPVLQENLVTDKRPALELDVVQQLVTIRRERIDWSPKLAALSARIDSSLQLVRIDGTIRVKRAPARFDLQGELPGTDLNLHIIYSFIDELRGDPRVVEDFPSIKLEAFKGGRTSEFDVICRPVGRGS